MAFPTVSARATGQDSNNTTSRVIAAPTGTGGVLLLCIATDGVAGTSTATANWTKVAEVNDGTGVCGGFYFNPTGAGSITITTSSERCAWVHFRIAGSSTDNPTGTSTFGDSTNSDPPSHTPPTGAQDYLWIAARMSDGDVSASGAPAGYANLQSVVGSGASGMVSINTAERSLNAATENPGAFTSATEQWVAWTLAVKPQTSAPTLATRGVPVVCVAAQAAVTKVAVVGVCNVVGFLTTSTTVKLAVSIALVPVGSSATSTVTIAALIFASGRSVIAGSAASAIRKLAFGVGTAAIGAVGNVSSIRKSISCKGVIAAGGADYVTTSVSAPSVPIRRLTIVP